MVKNEIIEIEIIDTLLDGNGVGKYEGVAVFVPGTVTGDVIRAHVLKVKPNCAYAKIYEMVALSDKRIQIDCPVYGRCGGCAFRHINYEYELFLKENAVKNNLKRIGGIEPPFESIVYGKYNKYRNKCQYPVANSDNGAIVGFYSKHSHRVNDCGRCMLQPDEFSRAVKVLKKYISKNKVSVYDEATGKGLIRHLYVRKAERTKEIMVALVINGKDIPNSEDFVSSLIDEFGSSLKTVVLNINTDRSNVILGQKCKSIYNDGYISDILCGIKVRISPLSFYQVNRTVAEMLYNKASEYAECDGKTVVDLYCGAGTIGLSMAKRAKNVIGVEIIEDAVKDAEFNAKQNGISNCRFICGDAKKAAEQLKVEGITPEVVILDPPRKGCDPELIKTVALDFVPERIVYVSCDSATLARDLKLFSEYGYETVAATPFDMFPRAGHCEVVCKLVRKALD